MMGERATFGDVSAGDTILLNGDFRRIKEIISRDEDECIGFIYEDGKAIWRYPDGTTRKV